MSDHFPTAVPPGPPFSRPIGVDVVQPMVPPYRVPLFEGLGQDPALSLAIQCAPEWPLGQRSVPLRVAEYHPDRTIRALPGGLLWQRGVRLLRARGPGDVLVLCGDLHYASNLPLIAAARRRGVGVVWWGHHRSATSREAAVRLRIAFSRRVADCLLTYTEAGVEALVAAGVPRERVFAAGNTIDEREVEAAALGWGPEALAEFAERQGLERRRLLLFCGVLNRKTRLDLALRALARLPRTDVELAVIGDGELRAECGALADGLGLAGRVRWLGEIRDQRELAPWFLLSRALVYPGAIGLALLHSFAYGLPVVTHGTSKGHMPEIEALEPEVNGLVFPEGDVAALAAALGRLLGDEELRARLSTAARRTVVERYSMVGMIARFKACLVACASRARV